MLVLLIYISQAFKQRTPEHPTVYTNDYALNSESGIQLPTKIIICIKGIIEGHLSQVLYYYAAVKRVGFLKKKKRTNHFL